jgi:Acyltransferase C-terminus
MGSTWYNSVLVNGNGDNNGTSRRRPRSATSTNGHDSGSSAAPRVRFPDDADYPSRGARPLVGSPRSSAEPLSSHDNIVIQMWDLACDVGTALVALWCIAGYATILVVLYMTIRPFSRHFYRRCTATMGSAPFVDAMSLLLPSIRLFVTADSDVPAVVGNSLLVSNHLFDADWWVFYLLGRCTGHGGCLRVFLRNEFLRISTNEGSSAASPLNPDCSVNGGSPTQGSPIPGGTGSSTSLISSAPMPSPTAGLDSSPSSSTVNWKKRQSSHDMALAAKVIHQFLDFPLMNGEHNANDREDLFALLRSFGEEPGNMHASSDSVSTGEGENGSMGTNGRPSNARALPPSGSSPARPQNERPPVQFLLFPEGWCLHNSSGQNGGGQVLDRAAVLTKSNEFASCTGRPVLQHLLLPRGRGFNASLDCLRLTYPDVYDVTLAYSGYDGSLPPVVKLSLPVLWRFLRRDFPRDVYIRMKKYSIDEILQDSTWLDKRWAEKDRLLSFFAQHQTFPVDRRGYGGPYRIFNTRSYNLEGSIFSLFRLMLAPFSVPFLLLLSIPIFWTVFGTWSVYQLYQLMSSLLYPASADGHERYGGENGDPNNRHRDDDDEHSTGPDSAAQTPGSAPSADGGTPYPVTPFVSPSVLHWRSMLSGHKPD